MHITKKTVRYILIISVLGMLVFVYFRMHFEKENFYDDFDAARKEYNLGVSKADVYELKEDDCVEQIIIQDSYDDNDLSNMFFHTNHDKVAVYMSHKIDTLPMKDRCTRFVNIMNEIQPNIDQYFKDSRYNQIFQANSGSNTMKYRGKYLRIYHTSEFVFRTSDNSYAFEYVNSMTHTNNETGHVDYYDFTEKGGDLTKFENRYGSESSSSETGTTKSTGQKKKSGSESTGSVEGV